MFKSYRKITIFTSAVSSVQIECDEVQFAGPTLIVWRDERNVAQFVNWYGWMEAKPEEGAESDGATVTKLKIVPKTTGEQE